MYGQACLERAFGQDTAKHLQFEQYLLMIFGDFARGLQALLNHPDASFAPLVHRPL